MNTNCDVCGFPFASEKDKVFITHLEIHVHVGECENHIWHMEAISNEMERQAEAAWSQVAR